MNIERLVEAQRRYFATGQTRPLKHRLAALTSLERAILRHEDDLNEALRQDLKKSPFETYMCETGMVLSELRFVRKHLPSYMKNKRVPTPLAQFHAKSFTSPEPYGVTLVMAPWNYPFMLALDPVIGAIAAGNCVVIKPSAYSPATSQVISQIIEECFHPSYVAVVLGGRQENQALLDQRFDFIFFTGGVTVGRLVMEKASRYLTPICLELGGKSPCIVDQTANIRVAARRIVFGKYLNCGQTCVAPDYLFVHEDVKDQLMEEIRKTILKFYGKEPLDNPSYGKIINEKHYNRLCGLMEGETILMGGHRNPQTLQIAPTVLDHITPDSKVMQEEIFGPILPVMTFRDIREVIHFVTSREKPLACYLFTRSKKVKKQVLNSVSFGGGCINDTIIHLATSHMGFGGVGQSGMGSYHGRESFETFSHRRSIVEKYNWIDMPVRYLPYGAVKEKLLHIFMR